VDIDAAAIWVATRNEQSLKQARELGIYEGLFLGNAKTAWNFIDEYQTQHGAIPSTDIIVANSGCVLKPPEEEERVKLTYLVEQLYGRAQFRALQYGLGKAEEELENGNQEDAVTEVLRLSDHLRSSKLSQLQVHELAEVAPEVLALYERVKRGETGVPFPWQTMTDMTLGMWPGTLTFFVARPWMGKTWTGVILAVHAWLQGKKVLFVTPEMSRVELGERMVAKYGQFAYRDLVSATLGSLAEKKFAETIKELEEKGRGIAILDDEEKLNPANIEQAIDAFGPELTVIDSIYMLKVILGRIKKGPGSQGDRRDRIIDTVEWLRGLSRRKNMPIIGISQLARTGNIKKEAVRTVKAGRGTGGLEDTVAISDEVFWACHNLFAMFQDEYMKQDNQLMYVPLKARRMAKISSLVVKWDMTLMEFDEIGTRVSADDYEDTEAGQVPY
jgi:replicative DNA helicase